MFEVRCQEEKRPAEVVSLLSCKAAAGVVNHNESGLVAGHDVKIDTTHAPKVSSTTTKLQKGDGSKRAKY